MARFSEMLLYRRRQLGMSVQQVANIIKIRPQIIEYFETGDFARMPPRGYAQGMVSSYARYLGLNPREVIDAYFDDLAEFERNAGTRAGRFQSAVMETDSTTGRYGSYVSSTPLAGSRGSRRLPQAGYVSDYGLGSDPGLSYDPATLERFGSSNDSAHRMQDDYGTGRFPAQDVPRSRSYGSPRARAGRSGSYRERTSGATSSFSRTSLRDERSSRAASRATSTYRRGSSARSGSGRGGAGRGGAGRGGSSAGFFSAIDPRFLFGIIGALVLVIILLAFVAVRGCTSSGPESQPLAEAMAGSAKVTVPQGSDAAASDDESSDEEDAEGEKKEEKKVPKQTVVKVSVEDGESAWIEIMVDGENVYAEQTQGPFEKEFKPKESMEIRVDQASVVTVEQDGEPLSFDRKTSGVSKITVDVPEQPKDDKETSDSKEASGDDVDSASSDEGASSDESVDGDDSSGDEIVDETVDEETYSEE